MNITKDTIIADVLKNVKGSIDVFNKHNMGCLSCMGVQNETIEKGSLMHGIDVNVILAELEALQNK